MERIGLRRLVVVLIADIVGYTRLMHADETGTHARVLRLLRELIVPIITEHRGQLVKTRGDGFLASFESPVEAVRAAIVLQQSMVGRNLDLPKAQWEVRRPGGRGWRRMRGSGCVARRTRCRRRCRRSTAPKRAREYASASPAPRRRGRAAPGRS